MTKKEIVHAEASRVAEAAQRGELPTYSDSYVIDRLFPLCLSAYNFYMNAVDRHDQMRAAYEIGFRTNRWWMRIYFYLLNVVVCNSYCLYRSLINDYNKDLDNTYSTLHDNEKDYPEKKLRL